MRSFADRRQKGGPRRAPRRRRRELEPTSAEPRAKRQPGRRQTSPAAARLSPRRAGDTRREVGRGALVRQCAKLLLRGFGGDLLGERVRLVLEVLDEGVDARVRRGGGSRGAGRRGAAHVLGLLRLRNAESRAVPREAASRTPPSRRVGRHGAARRACGNPSFAAASRNPRARRDLSLGRSPRRARAETGTHQELFRVGGDLVDGRIDRISAHGDGPGRVRLRREGGRGADENGEEGELHRLRRRGDGMRLARAEGRAGRSSRRGRSGERASARRGGRVTYQLRRQRQKQACPAGSGASSSARSHS